MKPLSPEDQEIANLASYAVAWADQVLRANGIERPKDGATARRMISEREKNDEVWYALKAIASAKMLSALEEMAQDKNKARNIGAAKSELMENVITTGVLFARNILEISGIDRNIDRATAGRMKSKDPLVSSALRAIHIAPRLLERVQFPEDAQLLYDSFSFFRSATLKEIYNYHRAKEENTHIKRVIGGARGSAEHRKLTPEKRELIRREKAIAKQGTWTATKKKLASKLNISVRSIERALLSENTNSPIRQPSSK